VSRGGHFLGEQALSGPVLWVGLEEHESDMGRRLKDFGADPNHDFVMDTVGRDPVADLRAAVEECNPVLVVVDTLSVFSQGKVRDPASSTEWTPLMSGIARVARDTNAAILLLHHARKDGGYRDSTAIGAGVDALFEMDAADGNLRVINGKGRWPIEKFSVLLNDDQYELASGELPLEARVLEFVEQHPGCSMRKVREGVTGKNNDIDAVVNMLVERGAVVDRGDSQSGRKLYLCRDEGTPS
jgi:hypothetical protein